MNIEKSIKNKFDIIFWAIILVPIAFISTLFILAGSGKMGYMPKIEDLENPSIDLATLLYDDEGEVLGSYYYTGQNRTYIEFNQLPAHLVNALIATEDVRFYKHSGIDFKGTMRAVILTGLLRREGAGGGSTITQQLAKLLFHETPEKRIERLKQKLKEYIIAVKLERAYTKQEIMTMYFNQFDYVNQATGINSASRTYFNVNPDSLKIEEAAVLVGMAQNPSRYNPNRWPERALSRRNTVLSQMAKYAFISDSVYDSLKALPLELDFNVQSHNMGLATYFREFIKQTMNKNEPNRKNYPNYASYQLDSIKWADDDLYGWCNKNTKPDGSNYNIYRDGLRIHTTINSTLQYYAEKAVETHLTKLQDALFAEKKGSKRGPFSEDITKEQLNGIIRNAIRWSARGQQMHNNGYTLDEMVEEFKKPVPMTIFSWHGDKDTVLSPLDSIMYYKHFLHTGVMSMEPGTGHVKAYVGGINYRNFKYDHVTQGKRQAGSTFKPFLYILAMQEGYSPCRKVPVVPISFPDNDSTWTPRSTCRPELIGTQQTLRWGLAKSENYISAWLVDRFKPKHIADIAYEMGIESYIDPVNSIIYGPSDMWVYEMVGAYGTFANKGVHVKPMYVTKIEDKYGNILATFIPDTKESIDEETAYLMLNLLMGVSEFGTAATRTRYIYNFTGQIAAKTGTTNDNADGWFMGVLPKLVTGVWVGADDRSVHFESGLGYGSSMALPIWCEMMQDVYADSVLGITEEDIFEEPLNFNVNLDCDKYTDESTNSIEYNSTSTGIGIDY